MGDGLLGQNYGLLFWFTNSWPSKRARSESKVRERSDDTEGDSARYVVRSCEIKLYYRNEIAIIRNEMDAMR